MLILLAILLAAPMDRGDAKDRHGITAKERAAYRKLKRDLWGPAKMPPAPTDFGPHFDFPPAPLNGGLTQDPYPELADRHVAACRSSSLTRFACPLPIPREQSA